MKLFRSAILVIGISLISSVQSDGSLKESDTHLPNGNSQAQIQTRFSVDSSQKIGKTIEDNEKVIKSDIPILEESNGKSDPEGPSSEIQIVPIQPKEHVATKKPTDKTLVPGETGETHIIATSRPFTTATPTYGPGSWNVTENNKTCIMLSGEMTIGYKNETAGNVISFKVPSNAQSRGNCSVENIILEFDDNQVIVAFAKNNASFFVKEITGHVQPGTNKKHPVHFSNTTLKLFETPLNQSYVCDADWEGLIDKNVSLKLNHFHVQAFKTSDTKGFDKAVSCEVPSHTPDVVPIVVGCALTILVILVLVAYVINRKRSQAQGYFSM